MNDYNISHGKHIVETNGSFMVKFKEIKLSSLEKKGKYFGRGLIEFSPQGVFFSAHQKYALWRICVNWLLVYIALELTQKSLFQSSLPIISFVVSLWAVNRLLVKFSHGFIPYLAIKRVSTVSNRRIVGLDFLANKGVQAMVIESREFDKLTAALKLGIAEKSNTSPAHLVLCETGEQYEEFKGRVYSAMQVSDFN